VRFATRQGFTLLELLVVLTIVAVLGSAATIGFSALQRDLGKDAAERITMVWQNLCAQSLLDSRALGLHIEAQRYQALQPGRGGVWVALPGTLFATYELAGGLSLELSPVLSRSNALEPQLGCAPEPVLLLKEDAVARFKLHWDPEQQSVAMSELDPN